MQTSSGYSRLVVGLGNPGTQYEGTRHNIGFEAVARLARNTETSIRRREFSALTAAVEIGRAMVLIMQPQTYMNRSGLSVAAAAEAAGLRAEDVVVAYDDVDLGLGALRIRGSGSSGGHRGVASIAECLESTEFTRVRLGVGRPTGDTVEYVLGRFPAEQYPIVEDLVGQAADACRVILEDGVTAAMNRCTRRAPEASSSTVTPDSNQEN